MLDLKKIDLNIVVENLKKIDSFDSTINLLIGFLEEFKNDYFDENSKYNYHFFYDVKKNRFFCCQVEYDEKIEPIPLDNYFFIYTIKREVLL